MMPSSASQIFSCHKISGGVVSGEAMVSPDDICFYLCDPTTGRVIEEGHALCGKSIAHTVLVFPSGKGSSVVQTDGLYQLAMHGNAPKAIVVQYPDTVLVASCIILDIPMVDRIEEGFYQTIQTGMALEINADDGFVQIHH